MATNKTRIGIRHGSGAPAAGANGLLSYELGWDGTNYALYISNNGTIEKVGGRGLFLPLTGGTLSDNLAISKTSSPTLTLKNTTMDTTAASISAAQYNCLYFKDKNDYINAFVLGVLATDGHTELRLTARRRNTANDNNVLNLLKLLIAADGTLTISVSSPAAWRSAIAAVNKAGDTMTDDLTIAKTGEPALIVNNTSDHKVGLIIGSSSKYGGLWDHTNSKWIVYSTTAGAVTLNGNANTATKANGLVDGTSTMTSAYNKTGLNYGDYTWLAGWNGYELRAVNKSLFAQASHSHAYLPLAGGTMNDEEVITFLITRKKDGGGGWAYSPIEMIGNDSVIFFNIGVYGGANTLNYAYIGANDWNSTDNMRIYADGTVTIRGKSIITSSDTTARKIWVTTSASTPVGAVNGDIVLVKVT